MYFHRTKQQQRISSDDANTIVNRVAPNCYTDVGRPELLPAIESEVVLFLARTKVDRFAWRQADGATGTPEMVCTSFSLLLWALIEQQRLNEGLLLPLAFCRVRTMTHSLCGFVNENREFRFVEPQNDHVMSMKAYQFERPMDDIQHVTFL